MELAALRVDERVEEVGLDEGVVWLIGRDGFVVVVEQEECWDLVHHFHEFAVHCHDVSVAVGWVGADMIDEGTRDFCQTDALEEVGHIRVLR